MTSLSSTSPARRWAFPPLASNHFPLHHAAVLSTSGYDAVVVTHELHRGHVTAVAVVRMTDALRTKTWTVSGQRHAVAYAENFHGGVSFSDIG